jgi:DNA-directed RNA polymerase subunit RPC12/RpoP
MHHYLRLAQMTKNPGKSDDEKPLSLHAMSPDEAIQKMFSVRDDLKPTYCRHCDKHIVGPMLIGDEGEIRCPKCGTLVVVDPHEPEFWP